MIGQNILWNPQVFLKAFNAGHDIAVHTWTHPYMTTLTNEEVIAELGYTMEIIKNSTGGRVPKYWRPPYGDADNRVNAIAREVGHRFPSTYNVLTFVPSRSSI
jgi:chitin deacetylase